MISKEELELYNRQIILDNIGVAGQEKLKKSKVLVIGVGGLGCPVLRYLVVSGVGEIGMIDFDYVSKSNLHRQILFDYEDVNRNKAKVAKEKLTKVNPFVLINAFSERLTIDLGMDLFPKYDVIVDCTDNYETRFLVNDLCVLLNKPFVYGAIYKFEGQVSLFNYKNGPTYRCLFNDYPESESIADCNSSGVLGVLPGIVGLYQANEVLKCILHIGDLLCGKLFVVNGLTNLTTIFKITENRISNYDSLIIDNALNEKNYTKQCQLFSYSDEISFEELKEKYDEKKIQIIDVRDFNEYPLIENALIIQIPLSEIVERNLEISKEKEVVLICKSGIRSKKALQILKDRFHFDNVRSYEEGLTNELLQLLDF